MSISALIRRMSDAGAPAEAIALAVEEIEALQACLDARRSADRDRKRGQRERQITANVTGQSEDSPETVTPEPSPLKVSPQTPLPKTPNLVTSPLSPPVALAEKKRAIGSCLRVALPPPLGVTDEQWGAFRKQRKKALNERSYTLICNKLVEFADAGWPPGEMIDRAIERGWETVFKPKDQPNVVSLQRNRPNLTDLLRASSGDPESGLGTRPALPASGNG